MTLRASGFYKIKFILGIQMVSNHSCKRLRANISPILYPFYHYPFCIWLCSSSNQQVESISPRLEFKLALWLSLANRLWQKWQSTNTKLRSQETLPTCTHFPELCHCHVNKPRLGYQMMRDTWHNHFYPPIQHPANHMWGWGQSRQASLQPTHQNTIDLWPSSAEITKSGPDQQNPQISLYTHKQ